MYQIPGEENYEDYENKNINMIYNKNLEEIDVIKASKENITKENEQVEKMNKDKIEEKC